MYNIIHCITFRSILFQNRHLLLSCGNAQAWAQDWWCSVWTTIFLQLSVPAFCRWNNYRHWWNHGGEGEAVRFVRESGLFVPWDQTLPLRHWNQGSEMKLGISTESNYVSASTCTSTTSTSTSTSTGNNTSTSTSSCIAISRVVQLQRKGIGVSRE